MADGDEIHENLPKRYLAPYQDLCSSDFDPEDAAHEVAGRVRNDAKNRYGAPPVDFISACFQEFVRELPHEPLLRPSIDYGALHDGIDRLARRFPGGCEGIELAKRAIRREIEQFRQGGGVPTKQDLFSGYLQNIHDARFAQRVPLTESHLNDLSPSEVEARLRSMRSYSTKEYEHLAKSLAKHGDVSRLHRRQYNRGLGLYDEVI